MEKQLIISYTEYDSIAGMPLEDQELMRHAIAALDNAYAPYSQFHVGAALRLGNGKIITGNNQENLAYPSGLCAERTAMFSASSQYPDAFFDALAVVGRNPQGQLVAAAPCGACRQVMAEYEQRHHRAMKIYTYLEGGKIRRFDGVESLLPFSFSAEF